MDRRRFLLTSLAGALAAPRAAEGQRAGKLPRVGYVQGELPSSAPLREAFLEGLRERGWSDGRNVVIDWRRRDDEIPDLVHLNVDVMVLPNPYRIEAGLKQTKTIPIVTVDGSWADTGGCSPYPQQPLVADDGTIFVYNEADSTIVAVHSFVDESRETRLPVGEAETAVDLFANDELRPAHGEVAVPLGAYGHRWLRLRYPGQRVAP